MSEKELLENSEHNSSSDENLKEVGEDNTSPKEKKGDKFDVWKEYKRLKKENNILLGKYDNDDDTEEEVKEISTDDNLKLDIFLLKNRDAVDYEADIKNVLKQYPTMSFEDAFEFSKAKKPKSVSEKDFSTNSATPKKELKDYTKEEILAMKDKKKLLEWSRLNGRLGK